MLKQCAQFDIYAFSRHFYPKRLTVHPGYTLLLFFSMCVPWELNTQPFALLAQCSTTGTRVIILKG